MMHVKNFLIVNPPYNLSKTSLKFKSLEKYVGKAFIVSEGRYYIGCWKRKVINDLD